MFKTNFFLRVLTHCLTFVTDCYGELAGIELTTLFVALGLCSCNIYDKKAGIEPTNRTDFRLALGCGQLITMWIPSTLGYRLPAIQLLQFLWRKFEQVVQELGKTISEQTFIILTRPDYNGLFQKARGREHN